MRTLNDQEKAIITLLGSGLRVTEIGLKLFMSSSNIYRRMDKLRHDFEATSLMQLIWIALKNNLL